MANKLFLSFFVKKLEDDIKEIMNFLIQKTNIVPKLAVILVGEKKESQIYVNRKIEKAKEIGFDIELIKLSEKETNKSLLIDIIERLNESEEINAILIQLPLPDFLKESTLDIVNKISPEKDIDGLTSFNNGLLNTVNEINYDHDILYNILSFIRANNQYLDIENKEKIISNDDFDNSEKDFIKFTKNFHYTNSNHNDFFNLKAFLSNFGISNPIIPCTPLGVFYIIKRFFKDESLIGKNAVIFGNSNLVGKPISRILLSNKITTTICHSKSKNSEFFSQNADIIVLATGNKNFFNEKFFNKNKKQIICDVGISQIENNKITGDLCNEIKNNNEFNNLFYTPVPFGIGKMTINSIMLNILLIFMSNLVKRGKL